MESDFERLLDRISMELSLRAGGCGLHNSIRTVVSAEADRGDFHITVYPRRSPSDNEPECEFVFLAGNGPLSHRSRRCLPKCSLELREEFLSRKIWDHAAIQINMESEKESGFRSRVQALLQSRPILESKS